MAQRLKFVIEPRLTHGGIGAVCRSPVLALSLAALFWAGNFIVARNLRDQIDPVTLNFARWLAAFVLFIPFVWLDLISHARIALREWRLILGLGLTGIAVFHTLVYLAVRTTTATNALLTLSLAPMAIMAGAVLIREDRMTPRLLAGGLISLAGAMVLITRDQFWLVRAADLNAGDLWMLAAVVVWAAYSLLLRRRPADLPPNVALAASMVVGLAILPLFWAIGPAPSLPSLLSMRLLVSVGYIAAFASVLAFLLWSHGVSALGPSRAGQFIHLMPVFGAALAALTLNEIPTVPQLAGGTLVILGIMVVERGEALKCGARTRRNWWRTAR